MARARNIKPSFFSNESLAECSPMARLLFVGLWTLADREGRLEYRPKRIKAQLFPFEECNIDGLLHELAIRDFVRVYNAGSCLAMWLPTFARHQKPHHNEQESELPPWSEALATKDATACDQIALIADCLNTDCLTLIPESGAASPPTDESLPVDSSPSKHPPRPARLRAEDVLLPEELNTPAFVEARDAWFAQRRQKRLSLRVEYIERAYQRLLPLGPANAAACLMHTVDKDYDGYFPEKFANAKPKPSRVGGGQRYQGD
jgi:hypothetical protein